MIELIVGVDTSSRIKKRQEFIPSDCEDVIVLDDINSDLLELERFVYPSLFSLNTPIVHAKYLIESSGAEVVTKILKTLISSPTRFILEERSVSSTIIKMIEKEGGIVHQDNKIKSTAKPSTIFAITNILTITNKKERWLIYQKAKEEHAVEALIGILYWKLRDLIASSTANTKYKEMYRALMEAHKKAWQLGTPLEIAIEKVILESR